LGQTLGIKARKGSQQGLTKRPGKTWAERIAILGLGPGDYRGAFLLRQVETMF
jgi:hypothetical protein